MKKVVILGGGFAGLTAASYLANSGYKVELIEASGKLGGRAYSFLEKESNTIIDNGQHILMGCYNETLKFLNLIGAEKKFSYQKNLKINFIKESAKGFRIYTFNASLFFYPFNLLFALLNYKAISFLNRLKLLKVFLMLHLYSSKDLEKINVDEWLNKEEQPDEIRKAFWEILAVGALNTNIRNASAKVFSDILKEIFFRGNKAATIVLPIEGLSESYCIDAQKFIELKGGKITLTETILLLESRADRITAIQTSQRKIDDFDFVISTLPLYSIKKILPEDKSFSFPELQYSSIISIHIWLKENKFKEEFYGLINSPIHWIFNHNKHITLVVSDANYFIDKSKEELFDIASFELKKYVDINRDDVISYRIIKEKRATFIPSVSVYGKRPSTNTYLKNFFLGGDWIETGLPSTIESAVKSGVLAAESIVQKV